MKKSALEHLLMGGRDRPMVSILDGTVTSTAPYLVLCTGEDVPGEVIPVGKGAVGDAVIVLCVGRRRLAFPSTQLAVPDPPTDWTPLTLAAGFTGGAWWCVRAGVVYLHGRVIRDAGNWPAALLPFATLPAAALPSRPTGSQYAVYCTAISVDGGPFAVAVSSSSGALSARAGAGVSTDSLELASLSWPVAP